MRQRWVIVATLAAALGSGGWFSYRATAGRSVAATGDPGLDPVPVLAAAAEARDVPIWLQGLGTVQASATVTVKAQADGMLNQVLFQEGQDVHAGDVLARIDPRTYRAAFDQAVARKAQDAATLANARVDLTRYTTLAATAFASAQQADTQRAMVAQLDAQIAQDQAQIDTAFTQLGFTTVTAPIDGRTGMRLLDQGNIAHAADAAGIVVITRLKPITVVFTLPQQTLAAVVAARAKGVPMVEALAPGASDDRPIDQGTLLALDNQIDAATGTIKLKAIFPNENLTLWPGGFVSIRLRVDIRSNAVVVPPAAVQRGPLGSYLYVIGEEMTASRRDVVVGHQDPAASIIDSGLQAGERVVTDGAVRLTDGRAVTIAQPPNPLPATAMANGAASGGAT